MLKKILVGALIILGSFGISSNSEAHHKDYYHGGYCTNDSYCDDNGCTENHRSYNENYRYGGCNCR